MIEKLKKLLAYPWENEIEILKIPEDRGGGCKAYIEILGPSSCFGDGDTPGEAVDDLMNNVLEPTLRGYVERGIDPPLPKETKEG